MSKENGNQPITALQETHPQTQVQYYPYGIGLTKREYFAALAMQGILANSPDWDNQEKHHEMVAKMSIGYADNLLKQLNPLNT